MKRDFIKFISRIFFSILIVFIQCSNAFAWTVAPVRFEVKGEKGKEYTLTFSVLNESQLYQKRFEIQTDDWIIDSKNNFLRKAFNKEVNNKYSASSWIKVTPQQFVVPPGETKNIRFTITVPNEIISDGEYSTGIFVGEKNIEKPQKGEKVVHIKQDTFIGVVVYIRVGEEKHNIALKNLEINTKSLKDGLSKVTVIPKFECSGNVHSRAKLLVKMEPVSNQPENDKKEFNAGELVVLRESEVEYPIDIPEPLKDGSEWKFTVKADFDKDSPILVGTKKYKIPSK